MSLFTGKADTTPNELFGDWRWLSAQFSRPLVRAEKDGPGWIAGTFRRGGSIAWGRWIMRRSDIVTFYRSAKAEVFDAGYAEEYRWQFSRRVEEITERDFLEEYAWVVLNCGFREDVVRRFFPFISLAFFDFVSAETIVAHDKECIRIASLCFENEKKLRAIVDGSGLVAAVGFDDFMQQVQEDQNVLRELPYIGSVTIMHLLKNIGAAVAKNDRHLSRLSETFGFLDAADLCSHLAKQTGEPVPAIDLVLWRFCTLKARSARSI